MKQKNVDSKAGTPKTENSIKLLQNVISKSASMLLIAMAGFGTMSFTQDDTSVNSIDTNLSVKKEKSVESTATASVSDACCGVQVAKPGDETKNAFYISLPGAKTFLKADKETAEKFMAEAEARRIWSMDIADASVKADKEMSFNFKVSNMYRSSDASVYADQQMINHFTEDILLKSAGFANKTANIADVEMVNNFVAENLSIKRNIPSAEFVAKADGEVISAFERANLPYISFPSQVVAHKADVEMIQHYQVALKLTETVVSK